MKLTERLTVRQHIITLSGCGNCHVLTLSANKRSASNSRSLLASLTSEPEDLFFLTNPFQLNTGTKTLLLVETLSPINGELGPCRQYWLLLLFCGLRPSPSTSYPTAGITLTSSHAHGGLDRVLFQWKSILQMGSIYWFQHISYIFPGTLDTCAWNVHLDLKKKGWSLLIWTQDNV